MPPRCHNRISEILMLRKKNGKEWKFEVLSCGHVKLIIKKQQLSNNSTWLCFYNFVGFYSRKWLSIILQWSSEVKIVVQITGKLYTRLKTSLVVEYLQFLYVAFVSVEGQGKDPDCLTEWGKCNFGPFVKFMSKFNGSQSGSTEGHAFGYGHCHTVLWSFRTN